MTPETFSKLRGCTETGIPTEIQEKSYTKMEVIYGEAYFDIAYFLYEDTYYLIECTKGQLFQLDGEFQMKLASDRLDGLVQDGAYAYYAGGDWKTRFSLLAGFTAGQDISIKRPVYYRLDLATMQEKKITLKEYWDICKPYEQLM